LQPKQNIKSIALKTLAESSIWSLAKRSLADAVSRLPIGARHAIFLRLARELGITGVSTLGEYGRILSAVGDLEVFDKYARTGQWASDTNSIIARFFAGKPGTYFDIGANIGLTTIPIARNLKVKCFAFEPDPTNFQNLRQNVLFNCEGQNVTLHNVALFNRFAELQFELAESNLGDHRLRLSVPSPGVFEEEKRRTISVSAVPLDEFLADANPPVAVKIDVQGAEPYVVEGGKAILSRADLLIIEFCPYLIRRLGGNAEIIIEFIKSNFVSGLVGVLQFGERMPINELCDRLRQFWEKSNHPDDWLDICLSK
jgi:FkbM family methyltransferase